MSKLSKKERDDLPAADFAGPDRTYPIEDKDHAEAAILDAHGPDADVIKRKAEAKLDKHPTRVAIRRAGASVASRGSKSL